MEMEGGLMLLPGERFCPMEDELLLFYLKPKVNGMKVPGDGDVICELDLYGDQDPWKMWESFEARRANDLRRNKDLYFFTQKKKKSAGSSRASRTVGSGGTWKGQNAAKEVYLLDQNQQPTSTLLGFKKTYTYKNKGSVHDGRWIMYEFELDESQLLRKKQASKNEYVLCLLRKNDVLLEKKRKRQEKEKMLEDYVEDDDGDNMIPESVIEEEPPEKRQRLQPCTDNVPAPSLEAEQEQVWVSNQQFLQPTPSLEGDEQERFWLSEQLFLQSAPTVLEQEAVIVPTPFEDEPLVTQAGIKNMGLQQFLQVDQVKSHWELAELEKWYDAECCTKNVALQVDDNSRHQQLEGEPQLGEANLEQQLEAPLAAADEIMSEVHPNENPVEQMGGLGAEANVYGGNSGDTTVREDWFMPFMQQLMNEEQPNTMMEAGETGMLIY